MRRHLGAILVGLGVFCLLLGALSRFYAYDKVAVVPLDQDAALPSEADPEPADPPSVSTATDATVFSIADLSEITTDLISIRNTIGQVEAAQKLNDETGEDLAVYDTFSFNVRSDDLEYNPGDDTVLSGTFDRVVFDRHTGEVYHCADDIAELCDEKTGSVKVNPDDTDNLGQMDDIAFVQRGEENFDGFRGQYFKMPFNTQKQDYEWWDGDLGNAADPAEVTDDSWVAHYEGEEKLDGLTTYKFVQTIPDTKTGTTEIPASIAGVDADGDITVDTMYSNVRTLWIEPKTGVLIKGQEQQHNYFSYEGEEVVTTTDALIAYDDATVQSNVDKFKPLALQLTLVRTVVPLIGLILGLVLIAVGGFLVVRARRASAG